MIYEIRLSLPPKQSNPNWHGHWREQRHATTAYRDCCKNLFLNRFRVLLQPDYLFPNGIRIHADFFMGTSAWKKVTGSDNYARPRDKDNAIACLKAAIDGMKDACLIPDDSARYVSIGEVRLFRTQKEHQGRCCLILRIEPCGESLE